MPADTLGAVAEGDDLARAIVVGDGAVGDAEGVFREALGYLARRLGNIRPLDADALPADRAAAVAALDAWSQGDPGWRLELVRFYEAHAPVALRPDPVLNGSLRRARRRGVAVAFASPLPRAAAALYLEHLGVARGAAVFGEDDGDPVAAARAALGAPSAPLVEDRASLEVALGAASPPAAR
jgi:hypothetical protein